MANPPPPYIPIDLLTAILIRLPTKPLIKFLTVSKSWYFLITHPTFISSHLNHHKSLSLHHLFLHEPHSNYSLFRYGHRTLVPPPPCYFTSVAASFNGLICFFNSKNRNVGLWNPAIDKFVGIQRVPRLRSCEFEMFSVVGLGFDCWNDDYKVVVFDYNKRIVEKIEVEGDNFSPYAQVYSINGGVRLGWRRVLIPDRFRVCDLSHVSEACFSGNLIHWIVFVRDVGNYSEIARISGWILTFDPRNECFGSIELPKMLNEVIDPELCLAVIDDSLAVIHLCGDDEVYGRYCAVVWKRDEGCEGSSWRLLYRISLPYLYGMNPNLWDEEDGKVFITTSLGTLIVFNVKSGRSSYGFDGEVALICGQAFSYTESLVLLDRFSGRASWSRKEPFQQHAIIPMPML